MSDTIPTEINDPLVHAKRVEKLYPWRRYWARIFDYTLFGLVITLALAEVDIHFVVHPMYFIPINFFWCFFEASLISKTGTTPGKALFGIYIEGVRRDPIPLSAAFHRATLVFLKGMGLCIPIVSIFTLVYSYKTLKREGNTSWDIRKKFDVHVKNLSEPRIIAAYFILAALFAVSVFIRLKK